MSDLKPCREAFEHWFFDEGESPRAIIRSGDSYRLAAACSAWNAWQACWAMRTQPEATAPAQDLSAAMTAKQCLELEAIGAEWMSESGREVLADWIEKQTASSANALSAGIGVDAERWRFMMRVADNSDGPEAKALDECGNRHNDDSRPESVQMTEIVDTAIRASSSAKEGGNG